MSIDQKLVELFNRTWTRVESAGDYAQRPDVTLCRPPGIPSNTGSPLDRFAISASFEHALAAAEEQGMGHISGLLAEVAGSLPWSQNASYTEAALGVRFMNNYAFALLTGPGAPLAREAPMSGFMLIGPHTLYPAHCHEPREIYLLLTPGSEWSLDGGGWFPVAPGVVVHHSSHQHHAMRTGETPMLAFAAWLEPGSRNAIKVC